MLSSATLSGLSILISETRTTYALLAAGVNRKSALVPLATTFIARISRLGLSAVDRLL